MAAKSASDLAAEPPVTVRSVFERPRYDKVMDPYEYSMKWLKAQGGNLRGFVDGKLLVADKDNAHLVAVKSPATNAKLARVAGMDEALYRRTLESSTAAQVAWARMDPYTRCTHLHNLARSVQKHLTSFGEMESLQSGKLIPFCMEEASQMVRYLYHYAGVAMTLNERFPESTPKGVVVVLLEDVRATCPVSAWRIGEILAAGNSLLIIAKSEFCLAPMHFAEIGAAGGLPPGLVNVLVGPFQGVLGMDDIGHVHAVASQSRCRELRQVLALKPTTSFSSYWGCGRAVAVVLEGADLHSAAAGIGQSFANSSGRGEACGVQVFVQECVYAKFMLLLRKELHSLRMGLANDRTSDMSVVFAQPAPPPPKIAYAELPDAELLSEGPYHDKHPCPPRPALFADVTPSSPVVLDSVGWPLVLVTKFRTAKESVTLVNSALHHSEVSVWTERLPAALELAAAYKATTVFVNGQGLRDASVEFGSRAAVACGERGLLTFVKTPGSSVELSSRASVDFDPEKYGTKVENVPQGLSGKIGESQGDGFSTLTTYKLFVGGQQARPASNASNPAISHDGRTVGYFPEAGRKDVRNAVEAALAGFKTWSSRSAHNRAQVLFYLAENLKMRATEMAGVLREMNGQTDAECRAEVDACVRRLFYWASMCDKDAGSVRTVTKSWSDSLEARLAAGAFGSAALNGVLLRLAAALPQKMATSSQKAAAAQETALRQETAAAAQQVALRQGTAAAARQVAVRQQVADPIRQVVARQAVAPELETAAQGCFQVQEVLFCSLPKDDHIVNVEQHTRATVKDYCHHLLKCRWGRS
ncbi:aldehyde dehydrogenase family 16 member A1-like [Rhipicephalus sanguineus]|uniref:aldehyde dehydrogenase family 16 member A1-like n=1 Tax=Rhipicephalus sanguineus TaxID=34632 RepID=UPI0020C411EC|nr:aldehyde dehydrogenase family 16 member A1-like [Rhipicephalus sanguineus]